MLLGSNSLMFDTSTSTYWGLCFTAEEAGSTISMIKDDYKLSPSVSLLYSIDGEIWTPFIVDETTITLTNVGDKVYIKAGPGGNSTFFNIDDYVGTYFVITGLINASGSIMSLLNDDKLNMSILTPGCFSYLFYECSLTTAPDLPATTLSDLCYSYMFEGCISLVNAPSLPATTLTSNCYDSMFEGCISLVNAPLLPATILANNCYNFMFNGCTSLNEVKVAFTSWSNTQNWLNNVALTGIFKCPTALGTNETITRGTTNCPTNWTVVNID